LFDRATAIRERQAKRFATLLRDWVAAGAPQRGVVGIERMLDEVVAPLAAESPVLLVVIDGMSAAVWRELVADLTRHEWTPLVPDSGEALSPVIATIPSVTEVSRTSLLYGTIDVPSDATFRTWDQRFEFQHKGTLDVAGRLLMPAPPRDMERFDGNLVNDGEIVIRDGGVLETPKTRYLGVYKAAVLRGTGRLRVESGGELLNPRTAGEQVIELAGGATATFDAAYVDNFDRYYNTLVGTVTNEGLIQVVSGGNGRIAGSLVNDGTIRVVGAGPLVIDVPQVAGRGAIEIDDGKIEFCHSADPSRAPVLAQPLSGHGKVIARSGLEADGASLTMDGYFYGKLGCALDVTAGETLYLGDLNSDAEEVSPEGVVRAFGEGTRLHLQKGTNRGLIEAGDGGLIWTYDHELTNTGAIHVQDGGTLKVRLNRFADDHSLFANHGTIRVDGGRMEFPGGRRYRQRTSL
jgi:hypothetical protein